MDENNPSPIGGSDNSAGFLAHLTWIVGALAVYLALTVWVGITTFKPVDLLFIHDLTYTECLGTCLWLLLLPLTALHLVMHFYQRHVPDGERFPGQLGDHTIPSRLRWLRTWLFVALVFFPTFSYGYFVGRMFDHLAIIWDGEANAPKPREAPSSKAGWRLLSDWGHRSDGSFIGPFAGGWRWYAWQDYRIAYGTVNEEGQRTSKNPHLTSYPGFLPTLYLSMSLAYTVSLGVLVFRKIRNGESSVKNRGNKRSSK